MTVEARHINKSIIQQHRATVAISKVAHVTAVVRVARPSMVSIDCTNLSFQDYIHGLNWKYKVALRDVNVTYLNSYAKFTDDHTLIATNAKGKETTVTSERFIIATGGRPNYPDIPGAKEYCITSDDIFSLAYPPGKTLVVGASYVALECGGFLKKLGFDVTVMVR